MLTAPAPIAATNRAVVIGLELPGFAKMPVAAQCRQQEQLHRRLSAALHAVAQKDRIVLDTPTGAAVVLFATPGMALNIACALCGTRGAESGSIAVRAGLAMGPVKAVPTQDGHFQIAGEALETAEHILALATGERVVTTLAYADALRREVPDLAPSLKALGKVPESNAGLVNLVAVQITHPKVLAYRRKRSGQSKPLAGWLSMPRVAFGAVAVMLATFTVTSLIGSGGTLPTTTAVARAPAPASSTVEDAGQIAKIEVLAQSEVEPEELSAPNSESVLPDPTPAAQAAEVPRQPHAIKVQRGMHVTPARHANRGGTPVKEASIEVPDVLAQAQVPAQRGKILLAIAPWGEVLVDGKAVGVSPPLTELELESGSHYLEVRNGAAAPLLRRVDIQGNDTLKIRHRFADSP